MSYRDAVREGRLPDIHGETSPTWLDNLVDYGILLLFPLTGLMICLALIFASLWVIVWVVRSLFS
jgi:hypothetical protein